MPEYIEREALKKALFNSVVFSCRTVDVSRLKRSLQKIGDCIDRQPTADVVEVVRCKDCGNYNKRYGECNLNGSHFGENGFCSCGAKMDK